MPFPSPAQHERPHHSARPSRPTDLQSTLSLSALEARATNLHSSITTFNRTFSTGLLRTPIPQQQDQLLTYLSQKTASLTREIQPLQALLATKQAEMYRKSAGEYMAMVTGGGLPGSVKEEISEIERQLGPLLERREEVERQVERIGEVVEVERMIVEEKEEVARRKRMVKAEEGG